MQFKFVSNDEQVFCEKGFEYTNEPTTLQLHECIRVQVSAFLMRLIPIRDDVCSCPWIKHPLPTELAEKYGTMLIACPKHEKGALE